MDNPEDIPFFVASFLSNAYKLNSWIPNTHLVFYQMFCSPKINKEERVKLEKSDILGGNIFNHSVSSVGYKSLLHSVLISGKKKHFKKILAHIEKHLSPEEIDDKIVESIINVAVSHNFPILLGTTMKDFLANGVKISKDNYLDF